MVDQKGFYIWRRCWNFLITLLSDGTILVCMVKQILGPVPITGK
uniref:Uncharacterized protein n=1 Tax=Anguilla anguilla TaxID=7936 RepID=A0A0E9ULF3_ANGAN